MNTPTTCALCGSLAPIERMARDSEGYWYCRSCRSEDLDARSMLLALARKILERKKRLETDHHDSDGRLA